MWCTTATIRAAIHVAGDAIHVAGDVKSPFFISHFIATTIQEKSVYQELEEEAAKSVGDKIETQLPKEPTEGYESVDALST